MGCWNGTCGISNLPIMAGDRIVLFVCKRNKNMSNVTTVYYSDDMSKPIYLPIRGEYNDYGSIENIDNSNVNKILVDVINKQYELDLKDVKETIDYIERDNIDDLFLFMVREDLYDSLVKEVGNRRPYEQKFNRRQNIISCLKKRIKLYKKSKRLKNSDTDLIKLFIIDRKINSIDNKLGRSISKIIKLSENQIFIDEMTDYLLFLSAINGLRMTFSPQCGAGSQSIESYLHSIVGQYMVNYEKEYRERDTEEDYNIDDDPSISDETKEWYKSDSGIVTKETSFWY